MITIASSKASFRRRHRGGPQQRHQRQLQPRFEHRFRLRAGSALRALLLPLIVVAALLAATATASAQANISFRTGVAGVYLKDNEPDWGTNVGLVAKFNITDAFRIRSQIDLDRVALRDVTIGSYFGDQTSTFTTIGFGGELELGGRSLGVVANLTPHMVLRTTSQLKRESDGREYLEDVARFSLGASIGIGGEWFITNNIGLEAQGQYLIYNFDHDETDPRYFGLRLDIGVQFYLGKVLEH